MIERLWVYSPLYLVTERKALFVRFRVVTHFCSDEELPISYILVRQAKPGASC